MERGASGPEAHVVAGADQGRGCLSAEVSAVQCLAVGRRRDAVPEKLLPHRYCRRRADRPAGAGNPRLRQEEHRRDCRRSRSEEHTSELQSLMRISYAVFCLKKKTNKIKHTQTN